MTFLEGYLVAGMEHNKANMHKNKMHEKWGGLFSRSQFLHFNIPIILQL